jgi:spore coat protein U-like protein
MSSRTMSNVPIGLAAIAGLLLSTSPTAAVDKVQGQKLLVQALVGDACTVTSARLDFPPYEGTVVSATGGIVIDCVAQTTLGVRLNGGANAHNGEGQRTMKHSGSGNALSYRLQKVQGGNAWLTDETVTKTITDGTIPVFGEIPGGQSPATSGLYTDEVTITLVF